MSEPDPILARLDEIMEFIPHSQKTYDMLCALLADVAIEYYNAGWDHAIVDNIEQRFGVSEQPGEGRA